MGEEAGGWMLDTGYWILDIRCLMLDPGCLILDVGKESGIRRRNTVDEEVVW